MSENSSKEKVDTPLGLGISDDDIYEAMKGIPGYLDITPADFKAVYHLAYRHALERLTCSVTAKEVMTREVAFVTREMTLQQVAEIMARRRVSGIPVVDAAGIVLGVISEKDFLSQMGSPEITTFMGLVAECLIEKRCKAVSLRQRTAEDLMTSPAVTVGEDTSVREIAAIFKEKGINRVPVTDAAGRPLGIVSRGDLLKLGALGTGPCL